MIRKLAVQFLTGSEGQDLIEYSLLLAFVCLAGAAAFIGFGAGTSTVWSVVNSRLSSASGS